MIRKPVEVRDLYRASGVVKIRPLTAAEAASGGREPIWLSRDPLDIWTPVLPGDPEETLVDRPQGAEEMSGPRISSVSRAALVSLGAPDYTRSSVVEFFVNDGETEAGVIRGLLRAHVADVTEEAIKAAIAEHPVSKAVRKPPLMTKEPPSRERLIEIVLAETTEIVSADGRVIARPNILEIGCRFIRTDPRLGYENPAEAAQIFAGFVADAILRELAE